jgi:hypothetical protein
MDRTPLPVVASAPLDQANKRQEVASGPPERSHSAPSASAVARVAATMPSKHAQLVAAVQALELLTNPADELGAPP